MSLLRPGPGPSGDWRGGHRPTVRRHPGGLRQRAHRFGYLVEIDPTSVPRKHTSISRFKHEEANVHMDHDGTVVAYMGDDERFDYLDKFVVKRKFRSSRSAVARRHNKLLLTEGYLFVARFSGTQRPANPTTWAAAPGSSRPNMTARLCRA